MDVSMPHIQLASFTLIEELPDSILKTGALKCIYKNKFLFIVRVEFLCFLESDLPQPMTLICF